MNIGLEDNDNVFKNVNSSFTDLFSILSSCENPANNMAILAYSTQNLISIHQCINHSVNVLLNGLQCIANLIIAVDNESMSHISKNSMGQFISIMCNLVDALNTLSSDVGYEMRQRRVCDY